MTGVVGQRERLESFRLPPGRGQRLLEVGCGNGARLPRLEALGYDVEGQDIAPAAVAATSALGRRVHHGELEALALPAASFDVVAMNHVLEHVRHPAKFLAQVHRLLRPGGRLVAIQPNGASHAHRRHGIDWVGLDPPRHLHAFTPWSAARAAQQAGFRDIRAATSAARTEHWTRESLSLRAAREGRVTGHPYARRMAAQLGSIPRSLVSRKGGDEIVLTAVR